MSNEDEAASPRKDSGARLSYARGVQRPQGWWWWIIPLCVFMLPVVLSLIALGFMLLRRYFHQ